MDNDHTLEPATWASNPIRFSRHVTTREPSDLIKNMSMGRNAWYKARCLYVSDLKCNAHKKQQVNFHQSSNTSSHKSCANSCIQELWYIRHSCTILSDEIFIHKIAREMLHCSQHGKSDMASNVTDQSPNVFSKKLLADKEVIYYFICSIWNSHYRRGK